VGARGQLLQEPEDRHHDLGPLVLRQAAEATVEGHRDARDQLRKAGAHGNEDAAAHKVVRLMEPRGVYHHAQ